MGAFCYLLLGGIIRQYTWFYHAGLVPLLVMIVLSLTPSGDGFSVDRLRKIARGQPVPAADRALPVYGWSRYICWLVVALAYFAAGMSKLGNDGLAWMNATQLKRVMLRDSLNPMEFDWNLSLHFAQAPDWFFTGLAVATVVGELAFVLVLFSSLARLIVPAAMVAMHTGILFFQNVLFPDLIAVQLMFYDLIPLRKAIGRRLSRRRGHLEILYDGHCALCLRTVRLLLALDLFERLKVIDFRQLDLAEYNRSRGLNLALEDLVRQMYVVSRRKAYGGFYGYRAISLALPALWPTVPWLFLPGVPWVGRQAYAYMARNRLAPWTCHAECPVGAPERVEPTPAPCEGTGRRPPLSMGGARDRRDHADLLGPADRVLSLHRDADVHPVGAGRADHVLQGPRAQRVGGDVSRSARGGDRSAGGQPVSDGHRPGLRPGQGAPLHRVPDRGGLRVQPPGPAGKEADGARDSEVDLGLSSPTLPIPTTVFSPTASSSRSEPTQADETRGMRVAFLTPEYPTERHFAGGLASYLRRVTRALVDSGHEAEVFALSDARGSRVGWSRPRAPGEESQAIPRIAPPSSVLREKRRLCGRRGPCLESGCGTRTETSGVGIRRRSGGELPGLWPRRRVSERDPGGDQDLELRAPVAHDVQESPDATATSTSKRRRCCRRGGARHSMPPAFSWPRRSRPEST